MFEQLLPDGWLSKISLRGAIVDAIGFGFNAGMAFGLLAFRVFWFRVNYLDLAVYLFWIAISLAGAIRFAFLAIRRAQEQMPRTQPQR